MRQGKKGPNERTFPLDASPLPDDELSPVLPPPLDLRPREAEGFARQRGVRSLVHRHVRARHLRVDVGRDCDRNDAEMLLTR